MCDRWREQRTATVTTASSTPAPRASTAGWGAVCICINASPKTRVQLRMDGKELRYLLISEWQSHFSRSTLNIILLRGETKISIMNNWISVNMYYVCIMYSYYLISRWMIFDIITENWSRPPGCDRGGWGGVRDVTRQDQCNPTRGGASQ